MKLLISFMTAVSLGLTCTCTVFGGSSYSALAAQGYRWVAINGPYACITEQDAMRIAARDTDAAELQVVESIECYYLIPGTIVQLIKQDPVRGISEIHLGSINRTRGLTAGSSASVQLRTPMALLKRRKALA
jgi:hypothetical protein